MNLQVISSITLFFDINKSTPKYGKMLATRPNNLDNAQVEFEIQLEERLKTVLNSNPEELQEDESKPKKRRKKNLSNEEDEEPEKLPSRKTQKGDPGIVSFFITYHKRMWTTKYKCTFVYEDDDDDIEIGEEVILVYNYKQVVYLHKSHYSNRDLVKVHVADGKMIDVSKLAYSKY